MATGTLGQAALSASTNTEVYSVPAATAATVNVSLVNRGGSIAQVRVAVASTTTPGDAEWLEYDTYLPPNGVLERTGVVMSALKKVIAYSSAADVTASVYGYEE